MAVTGFSKFGPNVKNYAPADQGNYFVATNPTPGTGIASGSVTTLADTTPLLIVKNNNSVGGANIYLDQLRLTVSAAGGGGTTRFLTSKTDTSQTTARYTSGGTSIGAGVNTNGLSTSAASNAQVYFGALTAAAAGSARLICHLTLREIIEIVQDTFIIDYGAAVGQPTSALATGGAATVARYFAHPPVVIPPQQHYLLHYWGASLTTASFEFVLGWTEA